MRRIDGDWREQQIEFPLAVLFDKLACGGIQFVRPSTRIP